MVFDLDPGEGVAFADVVKAALDVREQLQRLGLTSFCRTTGGKGLHVVVPLEPVADWDVVKPFCRAFAETLSQEQPERFLSTVRKADRRGRILIDWLRNGLGATAIASFSPRARDGATVATPVAWDEVDRKLDPAEVHAAHRAGASRPLAGRPVGRFRGGTPAPARSCEQTARGVPGRTEEATVGHRGRQHAEAPTGELGTARNCELDMPAAGTMCLARRMAPRHRRVTFPPQTWRRSFGAPSFCCRIAGLVTGPPWQ